MRILIADDHSLFRQSLSALLSARGHLVIGEAANGREAVELARDLEPEMVLMDLAMPVLDGLAATRLISSAHPEILVVILTASDDDQSLFDAIKSGAQGYLLKNLDADEFFDILDGVARGEPAITPALARRLMSELSHPQKDRDRNPESLTERELEVLESLVDGVTTNRNLSDRLNVSENTVKFHVRNIFAKLHLSNRAQVVAFALKNRLVEPQR